MSEAKIDKKTVVIALGSNVGNRLAYIYLAIQEIENNIGVCTRCSSIYETEAWGIKEQANFLNAVIVLEQSTSAQVLLSKLRAIEQKLGRIRHEKWGPRCIDLDILYIGDQVISNDELEIPHPHLEERDFVLRPLQEVLPDYIHPTIGKTSNQLLDDLDAKMDLPEFHIFA